MMKLERISANKIKYSITFEELTTRGFLQEEIMEDTFVWDVLFDEMIEEAYRLYKMENFGAVAIEIYSLTSQELVLILTLDEEEEECSEAAEEWLPEEWETAPPAAYRFGDFNKLVNLAEALHSLPLSYGSASLYAWKNEYFLCFSEESVQDEGVLGLCSEFGDPSSCTSAYLGEYGQPVIKKNAVETIIFHFLNR